MSPSANAPLDSVAEQPRKGRRFQTDVRTLVALVACCGLILWAWRYLAENGDPVRVESRAIQRRAIRSLHSGKAEERLTAIHDLERLHSGDLAITMPALVEVIDDRDNSVRLAAVGALGTLGFGGAKSRPPGVSLESAAVALTRSLKDPDAAFRVAVARNLGPIGVSLVNSGSGGPAVVAAANALMACLNDPEPTVRSAAAISLGKIDSPRLASPATPAFDRQAVMVALGKLLGDGDESVRLAAIHGLVADPLMGGAPAGPLMNGLQDQSPRIRAAAIHGVMLCRQGLDSWVPHLFQLAEHDPDVSVREQCFSTLSYAFKPPAITAAAVPDLVASLKSHDRHVRCQAAGILGMLKADAQAAIPELLRVMNMPLVPGGEPVWGPLAHVDPAGEAIWALGEIAPGSAAEKQVIAALTEIARSGPANLHRSATATLGKFPGAEQPAP